MYDFADRDHAVNYLVNSVVRCKGKPTVVQNVDYRPGSRKMRVAHILLRERDEGMRIDNIEDFDFKPCRLGMYNFRDEGEIVEAAWIMRKPARRWKVGLDKGALTVVPVRRADDNYIWGALADRTRMVGWWAGPEMADCIEGVYPTLQEALDQMGKRTRCSAAFAPSFAVTGDRELYYRHNINPVGRVYGGVPHLFADYAELRELLQEELDAAA